MLRPFKSFLSLIAVISLAGCGGEGTVKNGAHVRFFNAFKSTGDVRVYVGNRLLNSNGAGPNYSYGGDFGYADALAGTNDVVVNPYIDPSTTYASLTSQNLVRDRHYTIVGQTSSSNTRSLTIFVDGVTNQASDTAYFRIINASTTYTPVYVTLRRTSDDTIVYQSSTTGGLALGGSTGYRSTALTDTGTYELNVYNSSDLSTSVGSTTVTLANGSPKSMVVYDGSNSRVSIKTGSDLYSGD